MAKRIRFSLKMANGEQVRNIDDLRENFDLGSVLGYYADGKLLTWLEDRFYEDEAGAIRELDRDDPDLGAKVCEIFDVQYDKTLVEDVDLKSIELRNEKLAKLAQYTSDPNILNNINQVAFSQKDFQVLLEKKIPEIYLFQNSFVIPLDLSDTTVIGIGEVIIHVYSDHYIDFKKQNVMFNNISFDELYGIIVSSEEKKKQEQKSELIISSIYQIKPGESKVFEHNNVHIKSFINCEGKIEFNHCNIYYNETNEGSKIQLKKSATLIIKNSSVICKGFNENHFIFFEEGAQIIIEKTKFIDCSYFIKGECGSLTMKQCELMNCYKGFIDIRNYSDRRTYEISNTIITEEKLNGFNQNDKGYHNCLIDISADKSDTVKFHNNNIYEDPGFNDNNLNFGYLSITGVVSSISNCSFEGITTAISALGFKNCKFSGCKACIRDASSFDQGLLVDNCVFENSTEVIVLYYSRNGSKIQNCQFVSCYNKLISGPSSGGVIIEFCEFYNTKIINSDNALLSILNPGSIIFQRETGSSATYNTIRKCKFQTKNLMTQ